MSIGTLWTTPFHPQGKVIRAAAALGGLQIDVPEKYTHFEDNKKLDFLAKFPHGKIPAFEGIDGFLLTESYAISRYVASLAPNSGLLAGDVEKDALIDQWCLFAYAELQPFLSFDFMFVKGIVTPYIKPLHQYMRDYATRAYKTLNDHLSERTFLVGERLTLADITIAAIISRAVTLSFDAELRSKFPHVIRLTETIVNQPVLKDIYGPLEFVEKAQSR